jgi:3-oxoacyl-[acyl-carrier-protein] synthase III
VLFYVAQKAASAVGVRELFCMFIHGVGVAFPGLSLSNGDRTALGVKLNAEQQGIVARCVAERCGVSSQGVSLPLEYIHSTGNVDVLEAWKVATHSPTALGVEAARQALSQAGITIESVGLVVADTATPYQTCPSEAQRIAGEFGLKLPAYDIVGGIAAIPHYFSMFSSWREDRLPDYALCISTNTPSQHVCFKDDPLAASLFGDAAVAIVISKKVKSSVQVLDAHLLHETKGRSPVVVEGRIQCNADSMLSKQELKDFLAAQVEQLNSGKFKLSSSTKVIPPQLYAAESADILKGLGLSGDQILSTVSNHGFTLGSSYGLCLAQGWSALEGGGAVVMMHCGDGVRGSVVLGSC